MAEKPSGQCEYCGHMRYTNDLFNGECVPCVMWAEEQINELTREVARLQAELAKYTGPLNNRQREAISKAMRVQNNPNMTKWDAAIRAAREGER